VLGFKRRGYALKRINMYILIICVVFLNGCVMSKKEVQNIETQDIIKIGWEVHSYIKNEEGMETPYTDVNLVIEGKEKINLGSYMGDANEVTQLEERKLEFPTGTILALQTYCAGGGEDFCVIRKEHNVFSIEYREFYEASDNEDYEIPDFIKIKEVKVPSNSKIEFVPCKTIE
jgi:hypothetical protein